MHNYGWEQKLHKVKPCILSKYATHEFLRLQLCCCLCHQASCHVCCGKILYNNFTSVFHCSNKVIRWCQYALISGFLDRLIVPWLSSKITTGPHTTSMSLNNWVRCNNPPAELLTVQYTLPCKMTEPPLAVFLSSRKQQGQLCLDWNSTCKYFAYHLPMMPSQHHCDQPKLGHHYISYNIARRGECPSSTVNHVSLQFSVPEETDNLLTSSSGSFISHNLHKINIERKPK